MRSIHTSYLEHGLRDRRAILDWAEYELEKFPDFDAIAFSGMSGALIAPALADRLDKVILAVRKEEDWSTNSHSAPMVEGFVGPGRYVIIDDLVASGATWKRIRKTLKDFDSRWIYNGALFYNHRKVYRPNAPIKSDVITPSKPIFYE